MVSPDVTVALDEILAGAVAHDLESQTLEFKEQAASLDDAIRDLVDASVCFANASGGRIVVGVANKLPGSAAFHGCTLDPVQVQKRIFELTEPHLLVEVEREERGGGALLVIHVPQSHEIHADMKGRSLRRMGTDCLPMSPFEHARLREDRHGIDWSAAPSGRTVDAAAPAALTAARERLSVFTDNRRELVHLSDQQLLSQLNVIASDGTLTRAGEIIFCGRGRNAPARLVYQYRVTPGGEPSAIERFDGPLLLEFERVLDAIRARRHMTPITLPDGQQIHVEDVPALAVREALANALVHRDYHLGQPVSIDHSPEVFLVASPGPLVSGVTPENIITHPSKPRNRSLAQAARVIGFAEEIGRGVDRMYREMIRSGRDVPRITSSPDHVRVTLVGGAPNTQMARYAAQLPAHEREDTDTMLGLFRLMTEKHLSAQTFAPTLQKTTEEAEAVLRRLAGDAVAMLEPTRQSARRSNPTYRLRGEALQILGAAVAYQRRTTDEIDRKVIEHVQEYGKITNRTVRNLLDVGTPRAAAILGDLVSRDVLVKTSDAQRGPSVEYGQGPRFPALKRRKKRNPQDAQMTIDDGDAP